MARNSETEEGLWLAINRHYMPCLACPGIMYLVGEKITNNGLNMMFMCPLCNKILIRDVKGKEEIKDIYDFIAVDEIYFRDNLRRMYDIEGYTSVW